MTTLHAHPHAAFDRFPQLVRDLIAEFGTDRIDPVVEHFIGAEQADFHWDGRIAEMNLGAWENLDEADDVEGNELDGTSRRFHTLGSLGLNRWSDANERHIRLIIDSCCAYFSRNPYDGWFRKLDYIISGTEASYYDDSARACHLDLIPYATACKWTTLTRHQRSSLLAVAGDTLGLLLQDSPIRVLILNGNSVVDHFQEIAGIRLEKQAMLDWSLPRRSASNVTGFAYEGTVGNISGVRLRHDLLVLGFNHNIQSSFGVTTRVKAAIQRWIARSASEAIA